MSNYCDVNEPYWVSISIQMIHQRAFMVKVERFYFIENSIDNYEENWGKMTKPQNATIDAGESL